MFFNGMYPTNHIGGYPMGIGAVSMFGGQHPSSFRNGNLNYFSGIQPQAIQPIQTIKGSYAPNYVQANTLTNDVFTPQNANAKVQNLNAILQKAQNEQGVVGKFWDGLKGVTGIGLSSKKCQNYINKVSSNQMSYEEAYTEVSKYGFKQKSAVNMLSGIASGVCSAFAIGLAPATGGASILAAAGVGAASKAGIKTLDRATNNVQNDALNAKQIVKDGLSGALNGAVSGATIGIGKEAVAAATTAKEALKQGVIQGAKGGAISGAAIGAGDYTIECAFEDDQEFKVDDLVRNTAYSAVAGGATGAVIGGLTSYSRFTKPSETPVVSTGDELGATGADDTLLLGPPKKGETVVSTTATDTPVEKVTVVKPKKKAPTTSTGKKKPTSTSKKRTPRRTVKKTEPKVTTPKNGEVIPEAEVITTSGLTNDKGQYLLSPGRPQYDPYALTKGKFENQPFFVDDLDIIPISDGVDVVTTPAQKPQLLLGDGGRSQQKLLMPPKAAITDEVVSSGGEVILLPGEVKPIDVPETDLLKENLIRLNTQKKTTVAPADSVADNLKANTASVTTKAKTGIGAKIKSFFFGS